MSVRIQQENDKKLFAAEYYAIERDNKVLVYDIENVRLIDIDHVEYDVLSYINKQNPTFTKMKRHFSGPDGINLEQTLDSLIGVNLIGDAPFKKLSDKEITDYENDKFEELYNKNIMHIALNVTHKCNLNCDYCYGDGGTYGGPQVNMDMDTAKRAVDFLMDVSGSTEKIRITFFGGEPLLNFELIKDVMQYARKKAKKHNKKLFFGMTTNGTLLDDKKIDFILDENIDVTFSLDGPKMIQDKNRKFKFNEKISSYDIVYPKVSKFVEKAEEREFKLYSFRATLTRPSADDLYKTKDFFKGFKTKNVFFDYAEYNNHQSPNNLDIDEQTVSHIKNQVKQYAEEARDNIESPKASIFSGAIKGIVKKVKKRNHCSSPGALYIGISATGDIFPCHRFVGHESSKLGNVWDGFDRKQWLKKYVKAHIFSSGKCSRCWVRNFCGGICPATSYDLNGDYVLSPEVKNEPVHCKVNKTVIEEAMLLYSHFSENSRGSEQNITPLLREN